MGGVLWYRCAAMIILVTAQIAVRLVGLQHAATGGHRLEYQAASQSDSQCRFAQHFRVLRGKFSTSFIFQLFRPKLWPKLNRFKGIGGIGRLHRKLGKWAVGESVLVLCRLPTYTSFWTSSPPNFGEAPTMIRINTSPMLIAIVLLCPYSCGERHGLASAATVVQGTCDDVFDGCCDRPNESEHEVPTPCSDGCHRDCLCKGGVKQQTDLVIIPTEFWFAAVNQRDVGTLSTGAVALTVDRPPDTTRPNLYSGIALRLAIASLLL